ncbi:TetR/AcrR family transcriptional regulator [Sporosarcina thermotolerans]|uniref:TetR/AcrR family transcriptional regulator n=1 Tax=Sporosarcina thermotolerans TaxID=633404 RepID=A0AAW9AB05_9BACL|nr:TetR/AcrR family transcriptional regulator [Sporosarcina thermotolerans]MDW0118214.1 TetR/AcrR family transcriptional regulator [Sporosarcina thermotolerans]WHT48526.1 TetR/AcrR family transcriptional regulator [Sporosarcina thermotolerans]
MTKKQLIMEKALELFAKQGFEATSVQQITDLCGISKGAFYLSFKSKDELIVALIDHFMRQFTSDIDFVVSEEDEEVLLYNFYYTTFHSFNKHSDFAKLLMKEPAQSFNEDLFSKLHNYNKSLEKVILSMIERLYGEQAIDMKYDLLFCIKGFMSTYSELFLVYKLPIDLDLLVQSLVEKTNLLAKKTTISFIPDELIQLIDQPTNEDPSSEKVIEVIEKNIDDLEDSIEKESLILLKQELLEPTLHPAVVKGLLTNIQHHPHCKWTAYLLRKHFGIK